MNNHQEKSSDSKIKQNCPICNKTSTFDGCNSGKMVECPQCENLFVLTATVKSSTLCPDCNTEIVANNRICLNCGYSFDTFKTVEKHIPVYGEEFSAPRKFLIFVSEMLPGLFKIHILLLFFVSIILTILIFYFGLILLALGSLTTMIFLGVSAFFVYAHGLGFFLTGEVQSLKSAMAELTGNRWSLFLFMLFSPPIIIYLLFVTLCSAIDSAL